MIFLALVAGQTSAAAATPLAEFVETLTEGCIPGASPLPSKFFGFLGDTPLAVEGSFPTFTITLADGKELSLFGQSCASLVLPPKLTIDVVSCTTTLVKFDIRANGAVKVRLKDDGACFPKGTGVGSGGEPTASDVKFTVTYRPGEGDPDVQVTGNFSVPIKDVSLGPVPIVISQATVTLGSTGIGLKDVSVAFTGFLSFLNNRVTVLDARIGKAGFSGTIALKSGQEGMVRLLGTDFTLEGTSVTLSDNSITSATIRGRLAPPFFGSLTESGCKDLGVDLSVQSNAGSGSQIRASLLPCPNGQPVRFGVDKVFRMEVNALDFDFKEDRYVLRIDGSLALTFFENFGQSARTVEVKGLTIDSEGHIAIQDGGYVRLPEPLRIKVHWFELIIDGLTFGSDDGDNYWIAFNAKASLHEKLPLSAEVKNFKVKFSSSEYQGFELSGVTIDYSKAGVAHFKGAVDWNQEEDQFAGQVAFVLEGGTNLSVNSTLRIGNDDRGDEDAANDIRYFFIDLSSQFPAGIPLFGGVALYGIGGLYAQNMEPNLEAFDSPLYWIRASRDELGGTDGQPPPWLRTQDAFGVGAGVVLGSAGDDGYAINAKGVFLYSQPGPRFLFQGAASLFSDRGGLDSPEDEDPPFLAYALYDAKRTPRVFQLGVAIDYHPTGLDITGEAEAYFELDDPTTENRKRRWYLYLGKMQQCPDLNHTEICGPRNGKSGREIQARLLDFLDVESYLMIKPRPCELACTPFNKDAPPRDVAFGVGIGFDKEYKFSALKMSTQASLEGNIGGSIHPRQLQGNLDLDGSLYLRAFGFSLGLNLGSDIEYQSPDPSLFAGTFKGCIRLPWPLPDACGTVKFKRGTGGAPQPVPRVVKGLMLSDRDGQNGVEAARVLDHAPVVPLDVMAYVTFNRPVNPSPQNDGESPPFWTGRSPESPHQDLITRPSRNTTTGYGFSYFLDRLEVTAAPLGTMNFAWPITPEGTFVPTPNEEGGPEFPTALLQLFNRNPFSHYAGANACVAVELQRKSCGDCACYPCVPGEPGDSARCAPPCSDRPQCVLLPYQTYRIQVATSIKEFHQTLELAKTKEFTEHNGPTQPTVNFYFNTYGPPLDPTSYAATIRPLLVFASYVHEVVPRLSERPHFRGNDLAVRFNRSYVPLLYQGIRSGGRSPISCGGNPNLIARILNASRNPIGATATVSFEKAQGHRRDLSIREERCPDVDTFFESVGGTIVRDDVAYITVPPKQLRPGERHIAQLIWKDARLRTDPSVTESVHATGEALVYELPFLASRFESLKELLLTFQDEVKYPLPSTPAEREVMTISQGTVVGVALNAVADLNEAKAILDSLTLYETGTGDVEAFAERLADTYPEQAPTAVPDDIMRGEIADLLGLINAETQQCCVADPYTKVREELLSLESIRQGWDLFQTAFDRLDKALVLDRSKEPLPEVTEVFSLYRGTEIRALLLEFPEPLPFAFIPAVRVQHMEPGGRISGRPRLAAAPVRVVKNAAGTRLLIFRKDSGILASGEWLVTFELLGSFGGWKGTPLRRSGESTLGQHEEVFSLRFEVPSDRSRL